MIGGRPASPQLGREGPVTDSRMWTLRWRDPGRSVDLSGHILL